MRHAIALVAALLAFAAVASPAQVGTSRERQRDRARIPYNIGLDQLRAESWQEAAASFRQAAEIDPQFDMAYYMLGRASMALKKYVEAISAYVSCRDLYLARAGRLYSNAQEAQRSRNDRITELDEMIRQVQSRPQTAQAQEQLRQVQNQKRDVQDAITRGNNLSIDATVPAWVSLALGSAYFRAEKFADAEREYKAALTTDPRTREALNNLAVVYLETGRYDEADKAVKAAEKAGFRVNPMLKEEIAAKKKG